MVSIHTLISASATVTAGGKHAVNLTFETSDGSTVAEQLIWSPESVVTARRFLDRLVALGADLAWIEVEDPSLDEIACRLVGAMVATGQPDIGTLTPDAPSVFHEAERLIRAGLSVIWVHGLTQPYPGPAWWCQCSRPNCGSLGKHPITPRWQHSELTLLSVQREARRAQKWPPSLGLNHSRSLTWALDADTPEAVAWVESQPWATDLTAIIKTGKGEQWLFRQDESRVMIPTIPQPLFKLAGVSGLEVRGLDSQSVLPPSKHHYGLDRQWIDDGPLKLPPPDLLDLVWQVHGGQPSIEDAARNVNRSAGAAVSRRGVGTMMRRLAAAVNGGRNNTAYVTAQFIRDALDCGEIGDGTRVPLSVVHADYLSAASSCGLIVDEPDAVTGLWDRIVVGGERPGVAR